MAIINYPVGIQTLSKILLFLTVMIYIGCYSAKAEDSFRRWEFEIFGGGNVTIGEADYVRHYVTAKESKSLLGYTFGGEIRRNLDQIPFDLGLRLSFSKTGHDIRWKANENSASMWSKSYNNAFVLAAVGDWNFNHASTVSPFVGAGLGVALNEYLSSPTHFKPFVMPRVGIGINNRVRLTVSANFSEESQNTMMLTVGYMFGRRSGSTNEKEGKQVAIPAHINKLMRQSNACMWSGVGALCLGIPTLGFGLAIIGSSAESAGGALGGIITGVGGVFTLSSVPLFIISNKKKYQALRLSLQMSAMRTPDVSRARSSAPGFGISLAF